jgi:hypothetical protein
LNASRVAIETVTNIRDQVPIGKKGDYHPYLGARQQ